MKICHGSILIVDDTEGSRTLLAKIMSREGYKVHTASSGKEALTLFEHYNIDLCVLDVDMPHMNGFELAEEITAGGETQYIPFLFVTGRYRERKYILEGLKLGAVDFINKPVDREILISKTKTYFRIVNRGKRLETENSVLQQMLKRMSVDTAKKVVKKSDGEYLPSLDTNTGNNETKNIKLKNSNDKEKATFLTSINHEFRTPLNSIIGFSELLLESDDSNNSLHADQEDSLKHINSCGKKLLYLVNGLIELAQIKTGDVEIFLTEIDLVEVVKQVLPFLENHAEKQGVTIITGEKLISGFFISANAARLKQILVYVVDYILQSCKQDSSILLSWQRTESNFVRLSIIESVQRFSKHKSHSDVVSLHINNQYITADDLGIEVNIDIARCLIDKIGGQLEESTTDEQSKSITIDLPIVISEQQVSELG